MNQSVRTKYIGRTTTKKPDSDLFCCVCLKDIKPNSKFRYVHCVNGGLYALHPEDEYKYVVDGADMGFYPIGISCAKKIGLEWTIP